MKILTEPASIRTAIMELLGDPADERVIAVAYVGADALSFLSAPSGLTLYCWPQPGGTNPYAVEALTRAGVKVHFVNRLHAKVYWSRNRGVLVGSANLTANALGEMALQEAAVLVPPGSFDMTEFVRTLTPEPDFEAALKRLHEAHIRYMDRNPVRNKGANGTVPLPSFPGWLESAGRASWRLGYYAETDRAPKDAVDHLEKETGSRKFAEYIAYANRSDIKVNVPTLSFAAREADGVIKVRRLYWWVPTVGPIRTYAKAWTECPYLWFARVRIPRGVRAPFDASGTRFRKAFTAAIDDCGGIDWLDRTSVPTKKFVGRLSHHNESATP